jgi:septum formation protein
VLRLASSSPRRIDLLRALDVPFAVHAAGVDETLSASPASAKADAVSRPNEITLAADTEVLLEGEPMGKPKGEADAVAMLASLAGRAHDVRTEVVVVSASGQRLRFGVTSRVTLRPLSIREIERYVATGEPLDKAGAYAIQGEGRRLVARYDGCFANVTGLPLCHAYYALRRAAVAPLERPERACQSHLAVACPVWRVAHRQGRALRVGGDYDSWRDDLGAATGAPIDRAGS